MRIYTKRGLAKIRYTAANDAIELAEYHLKRRLNGGLERKAIDYGLAETSRTVAAKFNKEAR